MKPGELNPNARLNWENVNDIRNSYSGYYGQLKELAEKYSVSSTAILNIIRNDRWKTEGAFNEN